MARNASRFGLPDYDDIFERVQRGEKVNPLEEFIFNNEPAGVEDEREFCRQLSELVAYLSREGGSSNG